MPGKAASSVLRKRVWLAAQERCAACRKKITLAEMHCDHILPVAEGGTDDVQNLRCLCVNCHKFRHGWDGRVTYRRLLKSGWKVCGVARCIIPSDRVISCLKIQPPPRPPFRPFFVSYKRQLECGCDISVEADGRPRRLLGGQVLCCSPHSSLSAKEWRRLPPVQFSPMRRTFPRSWFKRFVLPGTNQAIL
jgi:hypothetical protein